MASLQRIHARGHIAATPATSAMAGFRITARDDEIVRFTGLHMAVEARQLAARFDMCITTVHRRAARLVDLGLLTRRRVLHDHPSLYTATATGIARADLELPPSGISLAHLHHNVELVWLAIELEREFATAVLSERQLRHTEYSSLASARRRRNHHPQYAVALPSADRGLHFPDLVVPAPGARAKPVFVELELTSKGEARRRRIVSAYRDAGHVGLVRYYGPPEVLRLLERTVADERASDLFELWEWGPTVP